MKSLKYIFIFIPLLFFTQSIRPTLAIKFTGGSISSINGIPYLTGLVEANDNTDAKTYAKVGALYYDLTGGQNFITQIRP